MRMCYDPLTGEKKVIKTPRECMFGYSYFGCALLTYLNGLHEQNCQALHQNKVDEFIDCPLEEYKESEDESKI